MRILFGSDFHGNIKAYRRFSELLENADFGILGGDLNTGFTPDEFEQIRKRHGIEDDDLIEELHSEFDYLPVSPNTKLTKAFKEKEKEYKRILNVPSKMIYFIMGNDDGIVGGAWDEDEIFCNIDMKRIDLGMLNIVGYQYTLPFIGGLFERREEEQLKDMKEIYNLVDESTILVTHGSAYKENDFLHNGFDGKKVRLGSKALGMLIKERKPRYHLYGHYHQKYGIRKNSINGSYPISGKFIMIDLDTPKVKWVK